jgi:divalent metal cation (Fe/Co/Zn/Cd) transporter
MVLALVVYSMVILFLVATYDFEGLELDKKVKNKWAVLLFGAGISLLITLFFAMFSLSESLPKIAKKIQEQKIAMRNENVATTTASSSGAITVAEINQKKRARLKDRLLDSFLFKRSSDVILIIVAASTALLLATNRSAKNNS